MIFLILTSLLLSAAPCAHMGYIYLWSWEISFEGLQTDNYYSEQKKKIKEQLCILTLTHLDVTPLH